MVRTGNVDFSCKRLTSTEIRKSKYHIIRRVRFRWDTHNPPPPLEKDIWIRACYPLPFIIFRALIWDMFLQYNNILGYK